MELAKMYTPADVEPRINQKWTQAGVFHAEPEAGGAPYSIFIPPPNVTAALHMGHALNNTLQDILTRYHRMRGDCTMWMPGTDHAGIATQTVVEKRVMQEEGKRRTDFTREAFVQKIQAWKDEYEATILGQLKAMGCSCDWPRTRFTMDPICARAVREAFFKLFKDGLIYRGKRLVNWDPVTQTALADDEVEMEEVDGFFYYMKYPLTDGSGHVTVATTRPETMLGDTAVAINPKDPRAAGLRGKFVTLPIVNRVIPIVEDDYVVLPNPGSGDAKAEFATGFLKVTPAHDDNDWLIGQRHKLAVINVFSPTASISKDHGWPAEDFARGDEFLKTTLLGKDRFDARRMIVKWFDQQQLFEGKKPYKHSVGHSYRSHVPIEPYLSDQWYVKVTDDRLAGAALKAQAKEQRSASEGPAWRKGAADSEKSFAGEGELRFYPERYAKTFQQWHENIRDWCISRQLWWGHQIPVWTKAGKHAVPASEKVAVVTTSDVTHVCLREDDASLIRDLEAAGFVRDPDVLDTWFSSGLWPLSTLNWPEESAALQRWNPSNVLCTAREIITLWVSRMVMFNVYFRGCLPFKDVFIHAMIQDGHGQKMSKSLGNGVDPMDIIHSHGSDAMRFTLASMTTQTQDVRLPVDMVCPHTGTTFTPKYITASGGYTVAAPTQANPTDPNKKMVSTYGAATGAAKPSTEIPLARNTSEKFDLGRNFANKLWNAVRFSLANLEQAKENGITAGADASAALGLGLADQWILTRLAQTIRAATRAIDGYEFKALADTLYDFIWRDLCDWYIESVKPTIRQSHTQCQVLATCIDVSLRLLHPVMPFVTEALWEHLNEVWPPGMRGVPGLGLGDKGSAAVLAAATWPQAGAELIRPEAEQAFALVQEAVNALRQVRTQYKAPPRQTVKVHADVAADVAQRLQTSRVLIETMANVTLDQIGANLEKPASAAVAVIGASRFYVLDLVDANAERTRLSKKAEELAKAIANLEGRLANESYVAKAPAKLIQDSRDKLAATKEELATVQGQLGGMK